MYERFIGVGRFRILGGGKWARLRILGGGAQGQPNSQQEHDVVTTSMRRNDVASMSCAQKVFNKSVPNNYISHLKIRYYRKFKEFNSLKVKIVLPTPSIQIKVTFIFILPFDLEHL